MIRFDLMAVDVIFVLYKVALGQVSLRVVRFSPVNIIPPRLRFYLLLIRTNGWIWELSSSSGKYSPVGSAAFSRHYGCCDGNCAVLSCSINLLLTTEAPFVTDMQFLYQQQHTAAKMSGWNGTDSRN